VESADIKFRARISSSGFCVTLETLEIVGIATAGVRERRRRSKTRRIPSNPGVTNYVTSITLVECTNERTDRPRGSPAAAFSRPRPS